MIARQGLTVSPRSSSRILPAPDVVANLRVDQAWGFAGISGARDRRQRLLFGTIDSIFNQMLVMTSGAPTVYACVGINRCLFVLVAQKLSHNLESSRLRIQQNFRT